jgi:hypothetical protein
MKRFVNMKRVVAMMAAVSSLVVVGLPTKAQALGFPNGDLAFVVYGGSTEYYRNLGSLSSLLAPNANGVTTLTAGELSAVQAGAGTGVKYSLLGISSDGVNFFTGAQTPTLTSNQQNQTASALGAGDFSFWEGQHAAATGGLGNPLANNPSLTAAGATHSFTSFLGTDGRLNGNMGYSVAQLMGSELFLFSINTETNVFTRVGNALLTANGTLFFGNPAVVPAPAAVVLFGTGLIGLVGVARRSLIRKPGA